MSCYYSANVHDCGRGMGSHIVTQAREYVCAGNKRQLRHSGFDVQ